MARLNWFLDLIKCANCGKESIYYCCWNTSYCDENCQKKHWSKHLRTCARIGENNSAPGQSTETSSPSTHTNTSRPIEDNNNTHHYNDQHNHDDHTHNKKARDHHHQQQQQQQQQQQEFDFNHHYQQQQQQQRILKQKRKITPNIAGFVVGGGGPGHGSNYGQGLHHQSGGSSYSGVGRSSSSHSNLLGGSHKMRPQQSFGLIGYAGRNASGERSGRENPGPSYLSQKVRL